MDNYQSQLSNSIQDFVLSFYETNPTFDKVKPKFQKEWTVLAAFVLEDSDTHEFQILSLATGTKSIGQCFMNENGYVLNDCHAEILAKRSLNQYFIDVLMKDPSLLFEGVKQGQNKNFKRYQKKEKFRLHLYISEPPCGDSSMLIQEKEEAYWTGAKSIDKDITNQQQEGITRLKSGRSDLPEEQKSLSMSCSDKILMWNMQGLVSPILGNLIEPIYLSSITIESDIQTNTDKNLEIIK